MAHQAKRQVGKSDMEMFKRLGRWRWFVLFAVLPISLVVGYYWLIAADQYVSESRFVVRSPAQRPVATSAIANLIQSAGASSTQEESYLVIDYIASRDAMLDAQSKINLRSIYHHSNADILSRFPQILGDSGSEALHRYFRRMVTARLDKESGVAILRTQAFSGKDAYRVNEQLLEQGEALINRLNQRAERKAIDEAEQRVTIAQNRVARAGEAIALWRNKADLLDPAKQATGVFEVANRLVAEQAALKAQLEQTIRAAPNNPSIPMLRGRIAALDTEIDRQGGKAVGTSSGIASKLTGYEKLKLEQDLAQQGLVAAATSLEQARADAAKQKFYLERVAEPSVPDEATMPQRLWNIMAVGGAILALYLVGWMLVVGIIEHASED